MPKGADLHYHQDGGIYAESYIRVAAEDGLCVDLATHALVAPQPACGAGQVAAAQALSDQNLYRRACECVLDAQLRAHVRHHRP